MPDTSLDFRSLFLHAWDLADAGVDPVMSWMGGVGLDTMCLASTYHNGWFLHPSHSRHRAYMTEGGVCFFHPDAPLYRDARLRPEVSQLCADNDWFAEAGRRADQHGLRLVSWTVGTHDSRLGLANPDLTQQNVYGDRLPHALCISNDDVRAYLSALCRDLATNHPIWAIQLEAFGWMDLAHGHHHERDLVGLTPLEQELISLCFCPACTRRADVDCTIVKAAVRSILDTAFREAPTRPREHPGTMRELEEYTPELRKFNQWRRDYANSVIADIKTTSLSGTSCRLILETGYDHALANVVDGFACFAYGQSPAEVAETCRLARQPIAQDWPGLFQCLVRLGQGIPSSESQLRQIVQAVQSAGCNGINFYNRSESPPKMLSWIAAALR